MKSRNTTSTALLAFALAGYSTAFAGTLSSLPYVEEFETDGQGSRYLATEFNDGDFLERYDFSSANPHPGHNEAIITEDSGANHAEFAFAAEDVSDGSNPIRSNYTSNGETEAFIRLQDIDVTGYTNLQVTVSLAATDSQAAAHWETDKFIAVENAFDGDSGGISDPPTTAFSASSNAPYVKIGQFVGTDENLTGPRRDADLNGVGDPAGTPLTNKLTRYTFDVIGSGNLLSVQIHIGPIAGNEELVIDEIRITGDAASSNPPVLSAIEPGAIAFTEGDAAKQVTNTITTSDDGTNLTGALVRITGNLDSSEDVLSVNGALPTGITAAPYNPATGLLELSGSSSVANYQAALRQIRYQNTDAVNPSANTRTVSFIVSDSDSQQSNILTRNINVIATIGSGTIPHTESFETDGEGARYLSNTFSDGSNKHFERHNFAAENPHPFHHENVTGIDGDFAWSGEASENSSQNPLGDGPGVESILRLFDLDASGLSDLQVEIALGSSHPSISSEWETNDYVRIQAAWDSNRGSAAAPANPRLLQGTYTTVGQFYGTGVTGQGPVQDADLDGAADPGGAELTEALQDFLFDIAGTGSLLSIQVVVHHSGNEELIFDNIRVTGTAPVDPTANPDAVNRFPTQSLKIPTATLLANDSDGGSPTNSITGVTASASGASVSLVGDNVLYNPNGVTTGDTFTYTVENGSGGTDTGTVTVNVIPDNSPGSNQTSLVVTGTGPTKEVDVSFAGIPGRTYRIQVSEDMVNWLDSGSSVTADAQGRIIFNDPPPVPAARFYRTVNP